MAISLIAHKRIRTTLAKAKALRRYIEPLLTKAKTNSTHSRRVVFSYLQHKESIDILFGEIATKIATRPGGYTRVLRAGFRPSDAAQVAYIELVDFNETALEAKTEKRGRTRRSGKKAAATTNETAQNEAPAKEESTDSAAE